MSGASLVKNFVAFHSRNPGVYDLFKLFTAEAKVAGHKSISADMILHRVRWETDVKSTGSGWCAEEGRSFKINNTHSAYYARLYILDHPSDFSLFKLRRAGKS